MEEGRTQIVEVEGHNYFVVDQDLSKGDRRCDGPAMATFFNVEAGSTTCESVRERHRLKKRREISPPRLLKTMSVSRSRKYRRTHTYSAMYGCVRRKRPFQGKRRREMAMRREGELLRFVHRRLVYNVQGEMTPHDYCGCTNFM
jgi:hypothetical protein